MARAGEPQYFERLRKNKDGSLHWDEVFLKRATLAGVERIVAFTREITQRKRVEQTLRATVTAAIDCIVSMHDMGIVTEFNPVSFACATIGAACARTHPATAYFSRGQRGEPRTPALAPVIKDAVRLLRATFPATIELHAECAPHLPSITADPVHIEQVLMNLCINARDAMDYHGRTTYAPA